MDLIFGCCGHVLDGFGPDFCFWRLLIFLVDAEEDLLDDDDDDDDVDVDDGCATATVMMIDQMILFTN